MSDQERMVQEHINAMIYFRLCLELDAWELRLARRARKEGAVLWALWLLSSALVVAYMAIFGDLGTAETLTLSGLAGLGLIVSLKSSAACPHDSRAAASVS